MLFIVGLVSALLGLGAGPLDVLAMDWGMRIPMEASMATITFMMGVAASSAGGSFRRGEVVPIIATSVMLGVLAGSLIGAQLLQLDRPRVRHLYHAYSGQH